MDVVGPAGRTGRDCALFPYIRKASQSLLSGSRGPVCELVSGSAEGARPGGCSVLRSSACGREQQTPQRGRNTDLQYFQRLCFLLEDSEVTHIVSPKRLSKH